MPPDPAPVLSAGRLYSYYSLVRHNDRFAVFWLSGVISQIGNWFNYIAVFVLLEKLTGRGSAVSWFLIAKFLPTALLGPAAGVVADRLPRKAILIACDVARFFVVLGFLLVKRPDEVWIIYLLAFVQESLWSFYDPARRSSLPNICKPEELVVANAMSGATWSVMLAFGAALGGFVTARLGWQTAIVIDATTFLVSAWMLAAIAIPSPPRAVERRRGWRIFTGITDLGEGFAFLRQHPGTAAILAVKSGWALSGGVLVLLAIFGEQVFGGDNTGGKSGILYSFRGIGAAIGPIVAWKLFGETRRAMHRSIALGFFLASAAYLAFAGAANILTAGIFVMIAHMGGSIQWVFSTTLLQQTVPDRFRGRVFATEMTVLTLVLSLSTYATGLALDAGSSPRMVAAVLALLFLLPGIVWAGYVKKINPA